MKWSWKIARFWGIDIYMHATFLLIILWVGLSYWFQLHSWAAVLERHPVHPGTIRVCRAA